MASSLELLIRDSTYDQLVAAVNTCVLPAGAHLIQISDGCVCLKVQVESLATLETLWRLYEDGILKAKIQALLVTDEMRELAGGEQVEAIVTIDEQEYDKARNMLANETQGKLRTANFAKVILNLSDYTSQDNSFVHHNYLAINFIESAEVLSLVGMVVTDSHSGP